MLTVCSTVYQRKGSVSVVREWTNLARFKVNFNFRALPIMKSSPHRLPQSRCSSNRCCYHDVGKDSVTEPLTQASMISV